MIDIQIKVILKYFINKSLIIVILPSFAADHLEFAGYHLEFAAGLHIFFNCFIIKLINTIKKTQIIFQK